jgi:hypothetical protein
VSAKSFCNFELLGLQNFNVDHCNLTLSLTCKHKEFYNVENIDSNDKSYIAVSENNLSRVRVAIRLCFAASMSREN